jgi:hypothetical protein
MCFTSSTHGSSESSLSWLSGINGVCPRVRACELVCSSHVRVYFFLMHIACIVHVNSKVLPRIWAVLSWI